MRKDRYVVGFHNKGAHVAGLPENEFRINSWAIPMTLKQAKKEMLDFGFRDDRGPVVYELVPVKVSK